MGQQFIQAKRVYSQIYKIQFDIGFRVSDLIAGRHIC